MSVPWFLTTVVSGLAWLGFVLHTSSGPELIFAKYSQSYALFLVVLTVLWLAWVGVSWRWRTAVFGAIRPMIAPTAITVGLMAVVLPLAYIWLHHRALDAEVFQPLGDDAHSFFQIDTAPAPIQSDSSLPALRVLAIGGSTTYGPELERDQAYPAILQRLVQQKRPNHDVQVLNAGVPWHTSMHTLLRYVARYADWKPHVVVVLHAFNDIFQASQGSLTHGPFRSDYGHFYGAMGQRVKPKDPVRDRLSRALTQSWMYRTWYSDLRELPPPTERQEVDLLQPLPAFERNIRQLIHRVRQDGAKIVLLTQPHVYDAESTEDQQRKLFYSYYYRDYAIVPSVVAQRDAMNRFNEATRRIARENAVTLIDLAATMPSDWSALYDDVHYTETGATTVAEHVSRGVDWPSEACDTAECKIASSAE